MSQVTVVTSEPRFRLGFGEVWRSRELLYFLAQRSLQVTYQQSLLGVGWVVAQPLVTMGVFTIFFGNLAGLPANGLPYPVFYLTGLVPFNYIRSVLVKSTGSVVGNKQLMTKVYIPRLLLPLAPAFSELVALGIGCILVVAVGVISGVSLPVSALQVPLWVVLLAVLSAGLGFWTSAINALFRDVSFVMSYVTQVLMFITPVTYGIDLVPERFRTLYYLNPFATAVDGFRAAVTGSSGPPAIAIIVTVALSGVVFIFGAAFFHRIETAVSDAV